MKKLLMVATLLVAGVTFAQDKADAPKPAGDRPAMPGMRGMNPEMLAKYDKDGDGKLNDEERAAMRKEMTTQRVAEMIKKFDKDGDGKLDAAELTEAMSAGPMMGMGMPRGDRPDRPARKAGEGAPKPPAPPAPKAE